MEGNTLPVPCHTDYKDVFAGRLGAVMDESRGFDGTQLKKITASGNKTIIPNTSKWSGWLGCPSMFGGNYLPSK